MPADDVRELLAPSCSAHLAGDYSSALPCFAKSLDAWLANNAGRGRLKPGEPE
ncbi:hypothetical protein [Actinoallomurus sp. NPDC050550]|uniref:hypothetical protein n=1 Tax=Actinoallomurus sp. NPDC050550 TaxID=3154937 RepID=UPI0033D1E7BC